MSAMPATSRFAHLFVALSLTLSGCAAPEPPPSDPYLNLPPVTSRAYDGPAPTIEIRPAVERPELGRIVEVTLTAPSGGHELILDHGDVVEGEALMFLTIEQPARDEVVTTVLETLRAEFRTDREFEIARVHIRTHRRGEVPRAEYRFAGDARID